MQSDILRSFALEALNLDLTEADAARAVSGLDQLRLLMETMEAVPLGFLQEPFIAPALGDVWLENWPEEICDEHKR